MIEDEPIVMLNSSQLEYTTSPRKTSDISKVADASPNIRQKHSRNVVLISSQNTMDNNEDIFNIELQY